MSKLERELQASVDYFAEVERQNALAQCVPSTELPSDEELSSVQLMIATYATSAGDK